MRTRHTAFIRIAGSIATGAILSILPTGVRADAPTAPTLGLETARAIGRAAAMHARSLHAGGAIAIVDAGGHLLYLERLDATFPAAATVATEKARTAAIFHRPTRDFENAISNGRTSLVAVEVMTPLRGGVPILIDEQVVGAIGVSGATSAEQDDEIAALAARTGLPARTAGEAVDTTTYVAAERTDAAFAKGEPLVETASYKVHASRRESPGMAEVHDRDTDIVYVLQGSAEVVTGGTVVDGQRTAPDERRGPRIDGGTPRRLVAGDLLIVPAGVPHWFRSVDGPFLYYVVKVTGQNGGTP